jgi:hypothetical protein
MKAPKKTDKKVTKKNVASGEKKNSIKPVTQKPIADFDDDDDDFDLPLEEIGGLDDFNRFDDDDDY